MVDGRLGRRRPAARAARPARGSREDDAAARARPGAGQGRRDVARRWPRPTRRRRRVPRRRHGRSRSAPPARPARPAAARARRARWSRALSPARSAPARSRLPDEGGRVTELMARPLLNLHVPGWPGFAQPLAGETAARRDAARGDPLPGRLRRRDRDADRRAARGRARRAWPRSPSAPARTATSRCASWARWRSRCSPRSQARGDPAARCRRASCGRGPTAPCATCRWLERPPLASLDPAPVAVDRG